MGSAATISTRYPGGTRTFCNDSAGDKGSNRCYFGGFDVVAAIEQEATRKNVSTFSHPPQLQSPMHFSPPKKPAAGKGFCRQ